MTIWKEEGRTLFTMSLPNELYKELRAECKVEYGFNDHETFKTYIERKLIYALEGW